MITDVCIPLPINIELRTCNVCNLNSIRVEIMINYTLINLELGERVKRLNLLPRL